MKRSYLLLCLLLSFMGLYAHNDEQRIWFNTPAKEWLEALPLGNGKMGAMLYHCFKRGYLLVGWSL